MIKVNKSIYYIIISIQELISLHYGMILSDRASHNYFQDESFFLIILLSGFLLL